MSLKIIKNVRVFDGKRESLILADIAIDGKYIRAVGKNLPLTGAYVIDGREDILSPGFIDAHGHSDMSVLACPEVVGKVSQGITTEIAGNCGLSLFPVTEKNKEHLEELYGRYNQKITWTNFREYAEEVNKRMPAINFLFNCGHNTLRAAVAGYVKRELSNAQLYAMQALLESELKMGACGLSTGLIYVPGKFSNKDEIASLLKLCGRIGVVYTTHMRSEGDGIEEALRETLEFVYLSRVRLHISHLKIAGEKNWYKISKVLNMIKKACESGLHITADRYPYTESLTQLSIILPPPFDKYDDIILSRELRNPHNYNMLVCKLEKFSAEKWKEIRLVWTSDKKYQGFAGRDIDNIAVKLSISPAEICARILRNDAANTQVAVKGMSSDNMNSILSLPYVCCGTDEVGRPCDFRFGRSHPRGFGSFPRFFNLLKKIYLSQNISEEAVICKILLKFTSLPAEIFRISKRGYIKPGFYADLVLLNPDELQDTATFANPHSISKGIKKVWVNGTLVWDEEGIHPFHSGKVLTGFLGQSF